MRILATCCDCSKSKIFITKDVLIEYKIENFITTEKKAEAQWVPIRITERFRCKKCGRLKELIRMVRDTYIDNKIRFVLY